MKKKYWEKQESPLVKELKKVVKLLVILIVIGIVVMTPMVLLPVGLALAGLL